MPRRFPPFAIVLALAAFVFAQLLATVHACDMGVPAKAPAAAGHVVADDCCDKSQPAGDPECDNHCRQASPAPERVQPQATASVVPSLVVQAFLPLAQATPLAAHSRAPNLARHIEPSIPIRNCCFRI